MNKELKDWCEAMKDNQETTPELAVDDLEGSYINKAHLAFERMFPTPGPRPDKAFWTMGYRAALKDIDRSTESKTSPSNLQTDSGSEKYGTPPSISTLLKRIAELESFEEALMRNELGAIKEINELEYELEVMRKIANESREKLDVAREQIKDLERLNQLLRKQLESEKE